MSSKKFIFNKIEKSMYIKPLQFSIIFKECLAKISIVK